MLFRFLLLLTIGYFFIRFLNRLFAPGPKNDHVKGRSKRSGYKKTDVEDADFEEIE